MHVAATLKQNTPNGCKLYVNGKLVGQSTPPDPNVMGGGGDLLIGRDFFGGVLPFFFKGDIDELEIFHRALSPAEIESISLAGPAGKCKDLCKMPAWAGFCGPTATVNVTVTVCNASPLTQTYSALVEPVGGAGCTGPPIIGPTLPPVTVLGNSCTAVPVTITSPPGLIPGLVSCYQVCTTNQATGQTTCCTGKLIRSDYWWINSNRTTIVTAGDPIALALDVQNLTDADGQLPYQLIVVLAEDEEGIPPVSLNSLPPGTPVEGTLAVPLGGFGQIQFEAELLEYVPFEFFDVLVLADEDDDGDFEVIGSLGLIPTPGEMVPPCPGDINGDGTVDVTDFLALLAVWGPNPGNPADIDGDGVVGITDFLALLAAWGPCG